MSACFQPGLERLKLTASLVDSLSDLPPVLKSKLARFVACCIDLLTALAWQSSTLLCMQVRCYSENSDNKPSTDAKFRGLQSTQEERDQRPGKHEILNVAEHDLEGNLSCSEKKHLFPAKLNIELCLLGLHDESSTV